MDQHVHPVEPNFQVKNNNVQTATERQAKTEQTIVSYEQLHGLKPKELTKRVHVTYNSYIQTDSLLQLQGADCKDGLNHHGKFFMIHQV